MGAARVRAGALLLDTGITPADIDELHAHGVRMLGEIGFGAEKDSVVVGQRVALAVSLGWVAPLRFGGASVPGSHVGGIEMARAVGATISSHINGGPTSRADGEIYELISEREAALEGVLAGNMSALRSVIDQLIGRNEIHRRQYEPETPSGTGVVPLGMLRLLTESVNSTELSAHEALCQATGGTAQGSQLTGAGVVENEACADLTVVAAPRGGPTENPLESMRIGNVPSVGMVVIDGQAEALTSSATPPPIRAVRLGELPNLASRESR